jgi:hypothetical protein
MAAFAQEVETRLGAGQPAFAAQLYTAIGLFSAAMEAADPVVRFLILFDAVHLYAEFKFGGERGQADIDKLFVVAEPTVPVAPTGKLFRNGTRKGTRRLETLYRKLRNDFVHSHERGADPGTARTEINANIGRFQATVAKILR